MRLRFALTFDFTFVKFYPDRRVALFVRGQGIEPCNNRSHRNRFQVFFREAVLKRFTPKFVLFELVALGGFEPPIRMNS